jgi:hypothetical protein
MTFQHGSTWVDVSVQSVLLDERPGFLEEGHSFLRGLGSATLQEEPEVGVTTGSAQVELADDGVPELEDFRASPALHKLAAAGPDGLADLFGCGLDGFVHDLPILSLMERTDT